ncbi:alpha/beta hydrolase [Sphingomonas sp.]|uniref:alpha/beta hydrolase n=1 Tax=Sphingomonas sp. TaxID=28214 RepID=UPI0035C7E670
MDPLPADGAALVLTRHPPPSKALWAAELPRALWSLATWWRRRAALAAVPAGDGRRVIVLPGMFNSDLSTAVMRRYLNRLGYRAEGWRLGRNLGVRSVGAEADRLLARIEAVGEPVALVGISLGGILARLAAHRRPDLVRGVVTIAAPYAGDGRATNVWRAFELVTGERLTDPAVVARSEAIAAPLPVPCTAIWSRSDGLVNGLICHDPAAKSVEVVSGHYLVQLRPQVLVALAKALGEMGQAPSPLVGEGRGPLAKQVGRMRGP